MSHADGTVMHLAQLDACTACVVTKMKTEVKRGRRRQMLFTIFYGRYLLHAGAGTLKVA